MSIQEMAPKIALGLTRYNPEAGSFEARAVLYEGNTSFTYNVSVKAPAHAEFETIVHGLKAHTLRRHQDAKQKTQKLIRQTVRSVLSRAKASAFGAKKGLQVSAFLSA